MISSYLKIISNRNFRNLWLGQVTSQIALNMLAFVLAIRVYSETGSNIAVSMMFLCFAVPSIIFGVLTGGIVDLFDKRKVMLFCNVSRVIIYLLFFIMASNLPALYFLSVIISILTQLFIPAEGPSIPLLVKDKHLLAANSLFSISYYLSTISGFILAGPMVRLFGFDNVYLLMGGMMLMAVIYIYRLPRLSPDNINSKIKISLKLIADTLSEGMDFIRRRPRISQSLAILTFSQALIATLGVLAPGFADKVLSVDLTDASYLVMGPAAAGLVLGALWVGAYGARFLKGSLILIGIISSGVSLIFLSIFSGKFLISTFILIIIMLFLIGVASSLMSIPTSTILQEESESVMRGRIYGVLTALTGGVSLLPVIFSGLFADYIGIVKTLFVLGCIVIIIGLYQLYHRNKVLTFIK